MHQESSNSEEQSPGSAGEVFKVFLKLGLTSFGGPIAHLGYFHRELVEKRRWVEESEYAQLLALSQFVPGPASSQLGFMMGLLRSGWAGGIAAFVAFTMPSAALLFAFAGLLPRLSGSIGEAGIQGLKLVALAVVGHGVLGMARKLCPDRTRAMIATISAAVILVFGQAWIQLLVVVLGAAVGFLMYRNDQPSSSNALRVRYGVTIGWVLIGIFAIFLFGLPLLARGGGELVAVADAFYRAGALVFGGGHVVLPLLEEAVVNPGWIPQDEFLAGYGAAQAVPGPMFSLAAYLGARLPGSYGGIVGASVSLGAIFLPGFLLVAGILPMWRSIMGSPLAKGAIAGVNAAVVGLLGAALYDPVFTSAVRGPLDLAIALVGFTLLAAWRVSAIIVVAWCVIASIAATFFF